MGSDVVLAIDLGTGGPKAALIGSDGSTIGWRSRAVTTTFVDDGGAEQDPTQMWLAVVEACRDVLNACGHPSLAAIAVTSQYMSTIPVDRSGMPTGPCILWMDGRGAALNRTLLNDDHVSLFLQRHGLIPLPSGHDGVAHIHVLRTHYPDSYAATAAFLEPMDYINARLTGLVRATQSTMFSQLVCDNRVWGATSYDPDLVAAARMDADRLPQLVPMNGFIGTVSAVAADQLGVAAGVPVAVGTIDSITSAVGSGAMSAQDGSVIIGTTSVLVTHIGEHRSDLRSAIVAVPSPLPQQYYVMAENGIGGKALEWAQQFMGFGIDVAAALEAAASVPPGSDGVGFAPWLTGALAPAPNERLRGAWVGLGLTHGPAHGIRAVLEGVCLNLAWLLPVVEQFAGSQFPFVRLGGGGAQSAFWAQILADSLNRPVHRLTEPRATNARGAAFLAFADLGAIALADIPSLLRVETIHDPISANRAITVHGLARLQSMHRSLAAT